jgi:hypothetical protein
VKVEYVGPHSAVDVPLANGHVITVRRGEAVDVTKGIADGLLIQDTWVEPKKAAPKKAEKAEEE